MLVKDNIKEYIVRINGGSGVIFQPADLKYTYVLTANHVFDDINSDTYSGKIQIDFYDVSKTMYISLDDFELKKNENYFPHKESNVDIAILKIDRIESPDNLVVKEDILLDTIDYFLAGYPEKRRKVESINLNWFRLDENVTLKNEKENKRREAEILKNQTLEELKGSSGGGILKMSNDYIQLAGIQSRIVDADDEALGNIEFTPISVFSEIVNESNGLLEEIIPCFLKCFSFIENSIFNITGSLLNFDIVEEATSVLKANAKIIINKEITPIWIKSILNTKLLLHGQRNDLLSTKGIWSAWYELLTILNFVKEFTSTKNGNPKDLLEKELNNVRLFYSDTNEDFWAKHIEDLALTNYEDLASKGLVIVASKTAPKNNMYILKPGEIVLKIDTIRKTYNKAMYENSLISGDTNIEIDNPDKFPFDNYRFMHIEAFKEDIIVNGYTNFSDLNYQQKIIKLKELYGNLIDN